PCAAPFKGDTRVTTAYQHVRETPDTRRPRNSAVPVTFEAIILQAMAKQPADRYASAEALRADLLRFRQGRGVLASPPDELQSTQAVSATRVQARYAGDGGTTTVLPTATKDEPRRGNGVFVLLLVLML